jgi:S-formylglutathione hydrolase
MRFSVYRPSQAAEGPVPALYFLSGLTATEENFFIKGGAQRYAAELGLILVSPDTSPRNVGLPGEDYYDPVTGVIRLEVGFYGAGFYVDATVEPFSAHYKTYSYVTEDLPEIVESHFPARPDSRGIFGHSMGGHGALVCALKNPGRYRSVSAFAPITAPTRVAHGREALSTYLGPDEAAWREYDASELVRENPLPEGRTILIDQGTADQFLKGGGGGDQPEDVRLSPAVFEEACAESGQSLELRWHEGYDHGYYFVSTFMEDHIRHHAAALNAM